VRKPANLAERRALHPGHGPGAFGLVSREGLGTDARRSGLGRRGPSGPEVHRRALIAGPVVVPISMAVAFAALRRLLGPRRGYNAGFALYWAGWRFAFPLWAIGGKRIMRLFARVEPPSGIEAAGLMLPVAGAIATALLPNQRGVDRRVAAIMAGSAVVNAVGEEVLWRGAYLDAFPEDVWLGAVWPWVGFTLWHLAPQLVFPTRRGRAGFLGGRRWWERSPGGWPGPREACGGLWSRTCLPMRAVSAPLCSGWAGPLTPWLASGHWPSRESARDHAGPSTEGAPRRRARSSSTISATPWIMIRVLTTAASMPVAAWVPLTTL
jgi:hypothetical protein